METDEQLELDFLRRMLGKGREEENGKSETKVSRPSSALLARVHAAEAESATLHKVIQDLTEQLYAAQGAVEQESMTSMAEQVKLAEHRAGAAVANKESLEKERDRLVHRVTKLEELSSTFQARAEQLERELGEAKESAEKQRADEVLVVEKRATKAEARALGLEGRVNALLDENKGLEARVVEAAAATASATEGKAGLEQRLREVESRYARDEQKLLEELEASKLERKTLEEKAKSLEAKLAETTMAGAVQSELKERVQLEHEALEASKNKAERQLRMAEAELKRVQDELERKERQVEETADRAREAEVHAEMASARCAELESKCKTVTAEVDTAQEAADFLTEQLNEAQKTAAAKEGLLREKNAALESKVEALTGRIEEAEAERLLGEARHREQVEERDKKLAELEMGLTKTVARFAAHAHEDREEEEAAAADGNPLELPLKKMAGRLRELEARESDKDALAARLQQSEASVTKLAVKLRELTRQLLSKEAEIVRLKQEANASRVQQVQDLQKRAQRALSTDSREPPVELRLSMANERIANLEAELARRAVLPEVEEHPSRRASVVDRFLNAFQPTDAEKIGDESADKTDADVPERTLAADASEGAVGGEQVVEDSKTAGEATGNTLGDDNADATLEQSEGSKAGFFSRLFGASTTEAEVDKTEKESGRALDGGDALSETSGSKQEEPVHASAEAGEEKEGPTTGPEEENRRTASDDARKAEPERGERAQTETADDGDEKSKTADDGDEKSKTADAGDEKSKTDFEADGRFQRSEEDDPNKDGVDTVDPAAKDAESNRKSATATAAGEKHSMADTPNSSPRTAAESGSPGASPARSSPSPQQAGRGRGRGKRGKGLKSKSPGMADMRQIAAMSAKLSGNPGGRRK